MRRFMTKGLALSALAAALLLPLSVSAQEVGPVNGHYPDVATDSARGGTPLITNPVDMVDSLDAPNTPGTLWDGGGSDGVNGLASERRTFTTGTGGPEGDHIATIADDFNLTGGPWSITEMRACMFQNTSTEAEAWIYNTTGTAPVLPVTDVLVGHSTAGGQDLQSIVFADNGTRCRTAFGYPGREFSFSPTSTGVTFSLPAGSYWLAVVGGNAAGGAGGGRAFRARSTTSAPPAGSGYALEGQWGSATFGAGYWSGTNGQGQRDFAFDIDGVLGGGGVVRTVDPNRQLGNQVHLPILNFQGQDDVCRTMIEVQYIGCNPSKAVLVTWGEPGFCPPQAAGPLKVECTGLLFPGSSWIMQGAQIPTGSKGGMLFKFTAKQLSDVGIDLGFDDVVADLMCETLFFGVVGDADDYRRFKKAYNEGLDFAGINQGTAAGSGFLAVEVLRHCPGDVTPGVEVSSKYIGIAAAHLGFYDPVFGGFGYYVPLIYANKAGLNTVMYIQNGGLECSSLELWFKAQDDCLRARICDVATLAPGETYQFDASDCVGPDWQGSAWIRASEWMGVAVDIYGRDILMTYIGEPAPYSYNLLDDKGNPKVVASPETGEKIAYGPLIYSEYQGWDTGVQVMNLSQVVNAKIKVYFLDRSGDVITTLVDWVCPRGCQTFFLPIVADLPGTWVGSIRVESQDWWTPGTNGVNAPDVVGVATLMKYGDVARTETQQAIAYNLLVEHKAYIWQAGAGAGGLSSGVGLIAIPSLLKDLDGSGVTSETAIMNLVAKPGFTDFAIYIYDQNGLLDFICEKLHSRQVEYIDLQTWGYVNNGFKGSAVISATFWEHDVFDPDGKFVRNLVGLGAVMVERTGTRLGEDIPGDEAAGDRGIPFALTTTGKTPTWCPGGFIPRCPGQPVYVAITEDFSATEAVVTTIPNAGPLPQTVVRTLTVAGKPADCLVLDVNVPINITHTWFGDLDVTLAHAGATSSMFNNSLTPFCTSNINVIGTLDDDSATSMTACTSPMLNNQARKTETGTGLKPFDGTAANGAWTLTVSDIVIGGTNQVGVANTLNSWGVTGQCRYRRLTP